MLGHSSQSLSKIAVALTHCDKYDRQHIATCIDSIITACNWKPSLHGKTVLLKPNLVSGTGFNTSLATSAPSFVAAAALWCKEHGAKVKIGDSPAFGSATGICKRNGTAEAVADIAVEIIEFATSISTILPCGVNIQLAREALECDMLLNLPRIKAHNQMYVTLSMKNLFGCVKGADKARLHMKEGGGGKAGQIRFAEILFDLYYYLERNISLFHIIDGITAMHKTGPMNGTAVDLGVIGGSSSAVALDSAILNVLKLDTFHSPLWCEAHRRKWQGSRLQDIHWSLLKPSNFTLPLFLAPDLLAPVRFSPLHYLKSSIRRMIRYRP